MKKHVYAIRVKHCRLPVWLMTSYFIQYNNTATLLLVCVTDCTRKL
jgi:hypothetical protein